MNYIRKMEAKQLYEALPEQYGFICFASFEKRCQTIPSSLKPESMQYAYVFRNTDKDLENSILINDILSCLGKVAQEVTVDLNNPVLLTDKIYYTISQMIKRDVTNIVIDITTFTHEALLILLKAIYVNINKFKSIYLLYNGAATYSTWLSKGCKEIRNVVGYPGLFNPAQKYHLIVLTGFEQERAKRLVELLEPDILSIGNGMEPVDESHTSMMAENKNEYAKWIKELQGLSNNLAFDFSCSDIKHTVDQLSDIINHAATANHILVPLNTKLSTIAVAIVALNNPRIQVCYPIPEMYNMEYSSPSNNATIVNFKMLMELFS